MPQVPVLRPAGKFTKNRRDAEHPVTRALAEELRALAAGKVWRSTTVVPVAVDALAGIVPEAT